MLRAAGDLGGDVDLVELLLQHDRSLANVLLAVGAPLRDHLLDLLVLPRMQRLEGEVLELPLERVDAEAVSERRVDLERLARLLHLLLLAEVLDRAQVVQTVGELDQDHADVLGHRHDQLAVVLRLRVLAALELDAGQLRDALDELRDLVAELRPDLLDLGAGVLDDVVQQGGRQRRLVELQAGEDLRDAPRVEDELLPRLAYLPGVGARGEVEGVREQRPVDVDLVRLDLGDQLLDEVLMPLEDCHEASVPLPCGAPSPASGMRRNPAVDDESEKPCSLVEDIPRSSTRSRASCASSMPSRPGPPQSRGAAVSRSARPLSSGRVGQGGRRLEQCAKAR